MSLFPRQLEIEVLQVVLASTPNDDLVGSHLLIPSPDPAHGRRAGALVPRPTTSAAF